jgi:hypothetical protein
LAFYLTERLLELAEAERELEAAKRLSDLRAAAKKLNRARAELRWFEEAAKKV